MLYRVAPRCQGNEGSLVTPDRDAIIERRDTFLAQEIRVAWAEGPERRPVRGVEDGGELS